jgi:lipoprotein-anchoring transpeptidase ErfK/SrfK
MKERGPLKAVRQLFFFSALALSLLVSAPVFGAEAPQEDLLGAKSQYQSQLAAAETSAEKRRLEKALRDLNWKLLFSKIITPDSVLYEVRAGDTLSKIAKDHRTTVELIVKINQIKGFTIYAGQKLKVVTAPFFVEVKRSRNRLYLRQNDEIIRTYKVATGEKNTTPLGTFTIENKLVNPTWYHAGAVVPPDSPDNILGTRWMGFSVPGYGIHGTTLPETIGTNSSAGCIRMLNQDVEELYAILPVKTPVTIVE